MIQSPHFSLRNIFAIIADILVEDYGLFPSCPISVILSLAMK
jgi:hypothetical protein